MFRRCASAFFIALFVVLVFSAFAQAHSEAPGWEVTATTYPSHLRPGGGKGHVEIDVYNIGALGSKGPVTVTDQLPAGVVATEAGDYQTQEEVIGEDGLWNCSGIGSSTVTCTNNEYNENHEPLIPSLPIPQSSPFGQEEIGVIAHILITVKVTSAEPETAVNHVTVAGGGALAPASTLSPITISTAPIPFGFETIDGWSGSADGTTDTQAGSHPYDVTVSFDLNSAHTNGERGSIHPASGQPRNIVVNMPPGLVGNPTAVPECTRQQFDERDCPPPTQVGIDTPNVAAQGDNTKAPGVVAIPVYNLVPPPGIPAEFAFDILGVQTFIDAQVRSGGDYGITGSVNGLAEKFISDNRITFWGEPADPAHDGERYSEFGDGGTCTVGCISAGPRIPFFTLPTACEGPQRTTDTVNSWENQGLESQASFFSHDQSGRPAGITGCEHLDFRPSISVAPDTSSADTPAGLTVDVRVSQEGLLSSEGLATSDIKDTVVMLPSGVVINPGQAAGLQACQAGMGPGHDNLPREGENGEEEKFDGPAECPNASKVGEDEIETPLLAKPLKGNVYVLQSNPPHLKLLVTASGQGVNLKLVGDVSLCENTGETLDGKTCEAPGQLITKFSRTPELPFTDFRLSFSGGAQAALDTPTTCRDETAAYPGMYTTTSDFTPWSTPAVGDAFPSSNFAISSGPGGSGCSSGTLPFSPELIAGSTTDQAGGFTSFSLLLQRGDGQQRIEKLAFKAPAGLSGMLSTVPVCGEPQAAQGTCSAVSQIGHATVASGPGPYPLTIPQPGAPESPIFLTGPYGGAPFGLTIVTHVIAGPFNLGTIVTRARIEVDPHTAQITVVTDPLPQVVAGVPTDLRLVDSVIDRPGFMFNPTNCNPSSFSGTATGTPPPGTPGPGASATIGSHFQVGSCQSLKFDPNFKVSTSGKTSKANGASLDAKVIYPTGALPANQAASQANIAKVRVELPKQLPSRLTTLQKACTAAQFNANPAGCPSASVIGHASAITPVLPVPLVGPAYFVSNGGEAFPNLIIVLQGDGVTIDLVSDTFISKAGITSSTFNQVPDAPVTSFDLTLPEGRYSALTANGNLCSSKLIMPTVFTGQNGAVFKQSTRIAITGCAKIRVLTRAQKLARALRVCRKDRSRARRAGCEALARRRYGPLKKGSRSSRG